MAYEVIGTCRQRPCDARSRITELVLKQPYNGYSVHDVSTLHALAKSGQLWVYHGPLCKLVRVEIFWSQIHGVWIARTEADGVGCNNLDKLPVYHPTARAGTVTTFNVCAI